MPYFTRIKQSYTELLKDLDSDNIPQSRLMLAQAYFNFTQQVDTSFESKDFLLMPKAWENFQFYFEHKPFNLTSLGLYIGDMDYSIKQSYLDFLLTCQDFIANKFLSTLVYDLSLYEQNKQHLPPCILFVQWLNDYYFKIKSYFKDLTQNHFNLLGSFNYLVEFEMFINTLFLRSKTEYYKNSFDHEYFLFDIENLKCLQEKNIYADILLKNNTIHLPQNFIDYIKFSAKKLSEKPEQQQSALETKDMVTFFITYQKQQFEYLFPVKNTKDKINKI